ncbi:MAG: rRNA (cytidine1920-2-O)/16S rRNA (cytidine1409-2-O)-methyltransferase [Clostridia bacterium]|jgi:23S rRNA (cytidine1920-2'-O)/16S rRNA (cytidine1409-2'-O)-methyltransferase|nr:rRNA (cytidine1920-2-O)/16S rRNA (cytidine1409-2-O)-methyltransferase [Clostridia bacterium]
MANKKRLDQLLVEKTIYESREKAKRAIMAGEVLVDNVVIDKPGTKVEVSADIRITGQKLQYVGRGGLKLEKAVQVFDLNLQDKVVMDIGASTGGFTDCALQNGAKKVYAVDVGYGQLAWKLRQDQRVVCMERTNARYLKRDSIEDTIDMATIDVSFISLEKILPAVKQLLSSEGEIVALVKPQFEAGKENVGKKGIVKDTKVQKDVLEKIIEIAKNLDLYTCDLTYSPIKGGSGNIEFLLYLRNNKKLCEITEKKIEQVIEEAHRNL